MHIATVLVYHNCVCAMQYNSRFSAHWFPVKPSEQAHMSLATQAPFSQGRSQVTAFRGKMGNLIIGTAKIAKSVHHSN